MAKIALLKQISTHTAFFNRHEATQLKSMNASNHYSLVVSANVVNHADDAHEFIATVTDVLAPDGIFVFEVPNVVDLIRFRAFETIYHEHVHYWSLESLRMLLQAHGMKIFAAEVLDYMCGSLRVFASQEREEFTQLESRISADQAEVTHNASELARFADDVSRMKFESLSFLSGEKLRGQRIVGIGAATKGNTLLNYFGLTSDFVDFVTDTSAEKIGKLMPGSRIPIVTDERLESNPSNTTAIVLPWNLDALLRRKFAGSDLELFTPQKVFGPATTQTRRGIYGES
jgi:hypothetical protein